MKNHEIPYSLIAKCLSNEATRQQHDELMRWRESSSANRHTYENLKQQWEISHPKELPAVNTDREAVWSRITASIAVPVRRYSRASFVRGISVAAGAALLVGVASVFTAMWLGDLRFYKSSGELALTTVAAPAGNKSELTLPDGTRVWLNSDSKITYGSDFNKKTRHITLEGEGYFDVAKDKSREFIVSTDVVNVRVYGTQFNVSAYPEDPNVSVSLTEGSVGVESTSGDKCFAELIAGEVATISKNDRSVRISLFDPEVENVWLEGKLIMRGVTADQLYGKLERWYGVKIDFDTAGQTDKYWITVKTESLSEILQLINKTTPIKYEINGEEVTVRYMK